MKKLLVTILAIALCLSLCACGESEEALAYRDLVNQIGTVTLDSGDLLATIENAYKELSSGDREAVEESYEIFCEKRIQYNELVAEAERKAAQEKRLNEVKALIDAIGDVTLESEGAIIAAEDAYAKLSKEDRDLITDAHATLVQARATYEDALAAKIAAERAAKAAKVIDAIDKIGKVTLDDKDAINNARKAYNALTAEEKALVTNYKTLQDAETEYNKLWQDEKDAIIKKYSKKFDIDKDKITGISWYMHENMPNYINSRSYLIPYIGVQGKNAWVCIRYNYTGDNWVFWESMTIMVDGVKYYKYVGYFNTTRDNDYGDVWEYYDEALKYNQPLDSSELQMLKAIAESKETIIRFQGDDRHYDLTVKSKDKTMIKDVLKLYEALIG